MTNESLFYYGAWIIPPVILFITAYTKNVKLFLVGILVSIFVSYSFYANSFSIELIAKENRRHFLVVDLALIGGIIMMGYSIVISVLFWNILPKKKYITKTFREFSKESSFYFILFFGTIIDIGLSSLSKYISWLPLFLSFFFVLPFLIKALLLKYPAPEESRGKTSKLTWAMLIFFILFFGYNIFWK